MANDEESVEKALMVSSSVAVASEGIVNSNLATLLAPAELLPGEVREPLSGGASPLSGGRASQKNRGIFTGPHAGYTKKGDRYAQQQDSLVRRRHAAYCRGGLGRRYPLQGSTPKQQQQ